MKFKLIKYRDAEMHTYTWFWINEKGVVISPYFDDEKKADNWAKENNINIYF